MEIKELVKQAHNNAINHGFWDFYDNLAHGHKETEQAIISQFLMLIVGEVSEAQEGLRHGSFSIPIRYLNGTFEKMSIKE